MFIGSPSCMVPVIAYRLILAKSGEGFMPSLRDSEAGLSKFANLVFIVVIACVGFFGVKVIGHLYNAEELRGLIEFQTQTADARTDKQIARLIHNEMRKLDINAENEDLVIESGHSQISISLYYEEDIELYINEDYNWILYTFEFDIVESGETSSDRKRR